MSKELSCGFIILNKSNPNEILACQAFGKKFKYGQCDIPKGHLEGEETPLEAAKRELKEETGFEITNEHIYDCGIFQYLSYKDLHVFLVETEIDLNKLICESTFEKNGKQVPEVIKYHFVSDIKYYYRSLQPIITECLEHYREGLL